MLNLYSNDFMYLFLVHAECENELQLYDFTTHECVSRCPCGYALFRSHSTSYCEAGKLLNFSDSM